jgi:uncharacterized protein (TIGR02996 family)
MTTEDEFQQMLDAHPDDNTTRGVLADWLQERGDERAEGYRALGVLGRIPLRTDAGQWSWWTDWSDPAEWSELHALPEHWHRLFHRYELGSYATVRHDRRREAEDAAAIAFAKLPAPRRAELLAAAQGVTP